MSQLCLEAGTRTAMARPTLSRRASTSPRKASPAPAATLREPRAISPWARRSEAITPEHQKPRMRGWLLCWRTPRMGRA